MATTPRRDQDAVTEAPRDQGEPIRNPRFARPDLIIENRPDRDQALVRPRPRLAVLTGRAAASAADPGHSQIIPSMVSYRHYRPTEDPSEYLASILSQCAELPGLMRDLDNIL